MLEHPDVTPPRRLRIVVLGYIIRGPLGGLAWHHLQYVAGLARLGHEVLFVEDSDDYPSCVHMEDGAVDTDPSEGLRFAERAFSRLAISGQFAYYDAHITTWRGPAAMQAEEYCRTADVVLNISAVNPVRPWWISAPVRVLIDTDPAFVQIRHIHSEAGRRLAEAHTAFFTFGENLGRAGCAIPDDGFPWKPTRQPVLLEAWPAAPPPSDRPFTTVMQWDSYKTHKHRGVRYGMKSASFEPYLDLPRACNVPLLLGIGGASSPPRGLLESHGWSVQNTIDFTRDPWQYQDFIRSSAGEFSVAKQAYVSTRSGWFSERSANYLASGRPVILQDTGFSDNLPCGEGLIPFQSLAEARDALEEAYRDLPRHAAAARRIAEEHFDSAKILAKLLQEAGAFTCGAPATDSEGRVMATSLAEHGRHVEQRQVAPTSNP
jgi:hypothetical protein